MVKDCLQRLNAYLRSLWISYTSRGHKLRFWLLDLVYIGLILYQKSAGVLYSTLSIFCSLHPVNCPSGRYATKFCSSRIFDKKSVQGKLKIKVQNLNL